MRVVGDVAPATVARLAAVVRAATLEDVLAWAHANAGVILEVIVQDEFTHDVIVSAAGSGASAYLCFDTT